MSVIQRIREVYKEASARESSQREEVTITTKIRRGQSHSKGNPTGSAVANCTAQLQMLRYPDISHPEEYGVRRLMNFERGDMVEAWFGNIIEAAFPLGSGLTQETFYFPVQLDQADWDRMYPRMQKKKASDWPRKVGPGEIWGMVTDNFEPPFVRDLGVVDGKPRSRVKLIERDDRTIKAREARLQQLAAKFKFATIKEVQDFIRDLAQEINRPLNVFEDGLGVPQLRPALLGFVLDRANRCVWVPTTIDRLLRDPDRGGLVVLEKKSMSNFAFRRAVLGQIDLKYRGQLASFVAAIGLPVIVMGKRSETSHLVEVFYSMEKTGDVKVTITKTNGKTEVYFVHQGKLAMTPEGPAEDLPDEEWEAAETLTPHDPNLMELIHDNVRRALLAEPDKWFRRYGPEFSCRVCGGTGTQTMAKTGNKPLKTPKPCEDCGKTGVLNRAMLPNFPCGYCPVVMHCWEPAGVTLEVTDKPRYWVMREAFEKSGITYTPFGNAVEPTGEETIVDL